MDGSQVLAALAVFMASVIWMMNRIERDIDKVDRRVGKLGTEFWTHMRKHHGPVAVSSSESAGPGVVQRFVREYVTVTQCVCYVVFAAGVAWMFYTSPGW